MKPKSTFPLTGIFAAVLFTLFTISNINAQYVSFGKRFRTQIGINAGPTFFLGDLGGNVGIGTKFLKDINPEVTKSMLGAYAAFYPSPAFGFRVAGQYTQIAGDDALIKTKGRYELLRKQRNLNFKSDVWEIYGALEIYPMMLIFKDRYADREPLIQPYGFFGLGLFHFDPMGSITENGVTTWHRLKPLRTEGQGMNEYPDRKPYSLTQINVPMGVGIRIALSPKINTGFECLYRSTFTDYMDDVSTNYIDQDLFDQYLSPQDADLARMISDKAVGIVTPGLNRFEPGSQRGNPTNTDAYFSFLFKVGFNIGEGDGMNNSRKMARMQTRCPRF